MIKLDIMEKTISKYMDNLVFHVDYTPSENVLFKGHIYRKNTIIVEINGSKGGLYFFTLNPHIPRLMLSLFGCGLDGCDLGRKTNSFYVNKILKHIFIDKLNHYFINPNGYPRISEKNSTIGTYAYPIKTHKFKNKTDLH